ncbi:MAG: hypothetical protein KDA20_04420 [Phycisphaerales bacterium]|nr:hypothetical protein [Phycisphaerales bacterium]
MKAIFSAAAAMLLAGAAQASMMGGLVIGGADDVNDVLYLEPGQAPVPLFENYSVWGVAADNDNGLLYFVAGDQLSSWSIAEFGNLTPPTPLVSMTKQGGGQLTPAGLTWANGKLYGSEVNSGVGNTGSIWEINTVTGVGTPIYTYDAKQFKLDALCFDDDSGLFYFLDSDLSGGRGLWSIDLIGGGDPVFITDFAASQSATLASGLAINKGRAYLVPGRSGPSNAPIAVFDLNTSMFVDEIENPLGGGLKQGGATWLVPTPGAMAIMMAGGIVAMRRRR